MVLAYPRMEAVMSERRVDSGDPGPLASYLRRLEKEERLKQNDVLARLGWARDRQPYYNKLRNGKIKRPSDDVLEDLDRAFELEPGSLAYWLEHGPPWSAIEEARPAYDAEDDEISALLERVSPTKREEIEEFLRRQKIEVLKIMTRDEAG